jgi:hypothetical protein
MKEFYGSVTYYCSVKLDFAPAALRRGEKSLSAIYRLSPPPTKRRVKSNLTEQ